MTICANGRVGGFLLIASLLLAVARLRSIVAAAQNALSKDYNIHIYIIYACK
jgi:hypothetical protein